MDSPVDYMFHYPSMYLPSYLLPRADLGHFHASNPQLITMFQRLSFTSEHRNIEVVSGSSQFWLHSGPLERGYMMSPLQSNLDIPLFSI